MCDYEICENYFEKKSKETATDFRADYKRIERIEGGKKFDKMWKLITAIIDEGDPNYFGDDLKASIKDFAKVFELDLSECDVSNVLLCLDWYCKPIRKFKSYGLWVDFAFRNLNSCFAKTVV